MTSTTPGLLPKCTVCTTFYVHGTPDKRGHRTCDHGIRTWTNVGDVLNPTTGKLTIRTATPVRTSTVTGLPSSVNLSSATYGSRHSSSSVEGVRFVLYDLCLCW